MHTYDGSTCPRAYICYIYTGQVLKSYVYHICTHTKHLHMYTYDGSTCPRAYICYIYTRQVLKSYVYHICTHTKHLHMYTYDGSTCPRARRGSSHMCTIYVHIRSTYICTHMTGAPVLGRAEGPSREDTRGRWMPPLARLPVTNDATPPPARGVDSVAEVRTREHRAEAELAQRRHGGRTGL